MISSCAIITTAANDLLKPIHERMPVILDRESEALWLDATVRDPEVLATMLRPYHSNVIDTYEVSTLVNSARNNMPEVLGRVGELTAFHDTNLILSQPV